MDEDTVPVRQIIVGRNSKVWKMLSVSGCLDVKQFVVLSHIELDEFKFQENDRVWVFSYSRKLVENQVLLSRLRSSGIGELCYVTSASSVSVEKTSCYRYPVIKHQCQTYALNVCGAKVLSIGLVYSAVEELPSGVNAATDIRSLAAFLSEPCWSEDGQKLLFDLVQVAFKSSAEKMLFQIYGFFQSLSGTYPCVLRPVDYLLRAMNYRWYGYLYLSNKIWFTKI